MSQSSACYIAEIVEIVGVSDWHTNKNASYRSGSRVLCCSRFSV